MEAVDFKRIKEQDIDRLGLKNSDYLWRWEWAEQYHSYNGPIDLVRWFEWTKPFPHYFQIGEVYRLKRLSEARNKKILKDLGVNKYIYSYVDEFNATDYILQHFYPVPERMRVNRILDFGAGYGRMVNLWSQLHPEIVYVGMDGIEHSYCLQNFYYRHFSLPLIEYMDSPDNFMLNISPGIYHLPTWRADLLKSNFFDLVVCSQVLPEINPQLARLMLDVFRQCLKPGGALYIRDHDLVWNTPRLNINELLPQFGFVLEFRPYVADNAYSMYQGHPFPPDIHGLPRIWRKIDPEYPPNVPYNS